MNASVFGLRVRSGVMSRFVSTFLFGLSSVACGDPLDLGQVIERTRPLGMRVSTDAEPARAWPLPGESATAEWLVVSPDGSPAIAWTLSACVAEETFDGPPVCAERSFAVSQSTRFEAVSPSLAFTVPADLKSSARLAVLGALCEGELGADLPNPCTRQSDGALPVSADLFVASAQRTNYNPDLGDDRIEIAGRAWAEPPSPPVAPCDDPAAMRVRASRGKRTIRIVFEGDDREELAPGESPFGDTREALVVSHFSTRGELERQFSVVEASDDTPAPTVAVEWKPPPADTVPANGAAATFFFVVRDGRGGADWTQRDLCILP